MKMKEALKEGKGRARRTIWTEPDCYLKHISGTPTHQLWSRRTQEIINCETPQILILLQDDDNDWIPFTGSIDKEDKEITDDLTGVFKRRLEELKTQCL